MPSVIVKGLEVHKPPTASIDEGYIGGTIVLKTRRPLDMDVNTISASIEAAYSETSGETDPLIDAMYSWKDDSEKFGVMISAVQQKRSLELQGFEVLGWAESDSDDYSIPTVMGAPIFKQ